MQINEIITFKADTNKYKNLQRTNLFIIINKKQNMDLNITSKKFD